MNLTEATILALQDKLVENCDKETCKYKEVKTESQVSDAADAINYEHRQNPSESNAIPFFAGVISDVAEEMGDDYSEWLGEDAVRDIIDILFDNDQLWDTLTGIVEDAVRTKIEEIRGVPGEDLEESKTVRR